MSKFDIIKIGDKVVDWYLRVRPKWVNKISSFLIFSGVALLGSPIWKPYLDAWLEKEFDISIPDEANVWLGLVLIVLGLVFYYLNEKINAVDLLSDAESTLEHDSVILKNLFRISNPSRSRGILEHLASNDAWFKIQCDRFYDLHELLTADEFSFLDQTMERQRQNLAKYTGRLINFTATHFFIYPNHDFGDNGHQSCLYPDHNIDRGASRANEEGRRMYFEKQRELHALINENMQAFRDFQTTSQQLLKNRYLLAIEQSEAA